jgi:hypothetical protein
MKTHFICLANSKKYGERCIAGIEVNLDENAGYKTILKTYKPKWIRPVTNDEFGQIPASLVQHLKLYDLVELDVIEHQPNGYQSENVLFEKNSIRVLRNLSMDVDCIEKMCDNYPDRLFGNCGKAIPFDRIKEIDYSLKLVKIENPEFYYFNSSTCSNQLRVKFMYFTNEYDLVVTDVNFKIAFEADNEILLFSNHFFFVISLGLAFNEFHYKLVAGILHFE